MRISKPPIALKDNVITFIISLPAKARGSDISINAEL